MPAVDFYIDNPGGVVYLRPVTSRAELWLVANACAESWQWQNGILCIDGRVGIDLVQAILDEGFTLARK